MDIADYKRIMEQYDELISAMHGIPKERAIEARLDFASKAFVSPQFTMKASWHIKEGQAVTVDRVMLMHPIELCIVYNNLTKDWNKALDMLQNYLHEMIDMKFGKLSKT